MSTKTVEEVLEMHGLSKIRPPPSFRVHATKCPNCMVDEEGQVWACPIGCELRQKERKARL